MLILKSCILSGTFIIKINNDPKNFLKVIEGKLKIQNGFLYFSGKARVRGPKNNEINSDGETDFKDSKNNPVIPVELTFNKTKIYIKKNINQQVSSYFSQKIRDLLDIVSFNKKPIKK